MCAPDVDVENNNANYMPQREGGSGCFNTSFLLTSSQSSHPSSLTISMWSCCDDVTNNTLTVPSVFCVCKLFVFCYATPSHVCTPWCTLCVKITPYSSLHQLLSDAGPTLRGWTAAGLWGVSSAGSRVEVTPDLILHLLLPSTHPPHHLPFLPLP